MPRLFCLHNADNRCKRTQVVAYSKGFMKKMKKGRRGGWIWLGCFWSVDLRCMACIAHQWPFAGGLWLQPEASHCWGGPWCGPPLVFCHRQDEVGRRQGWDFLRLCSFGGHQNRFLGWLANGHLEIRIFVGWEFLCLSELTGYFERFVICFPFLGPFVPFFGGRKLDWNQ